MAAQARISAFSRSNYSPVMTPVAPPVIAWEGGTAVVFDLVLIGLAIALDPLPLTAFLIVLPSKRGVRKGAAFVFGWLASLAIVVTVTVLATGDNPPKPNTAPSLADLAVKIAIGVSLVAIAVRQRRRMERPKKPKKPPKWQEHVDRMSPWFAMALGAHSSHGF